MIAHTGLTVRDYKTAKKFYQKALTPLGYKMTMDMPKWKAAGFKEGGHTSFWVVEKKPMMAGHIAFLAKSKSAVQRFHAAALAAGGKDNGAPGFRSAYGPTYYAAFIHDADGNNVEACYFGAHAPVAKKKSVKKSVKKVKKVAKKNTKKRR